MINPASMPTPKSAVQPHVAPVDMPAPSVAGGSATAAPIPTPTITETVLDNGVRVIVEERPGSETADIAIGLRSGSVNDPQKKVGLTNVMGELMLKGTKERTGAKIRREIAAQGGATAITPGKTSFMLAGSVATEEVGNALDLYTDVFTHPNRKFKNIKDTKELAVQTLKGEATPEVNATKEFPRLLFGDQPIAKPVNGNVQSVSKVNWFNLWWHKYKNLVGPNVVLTYSGDPAAFDLNKVKSTLGKLPARQRTDNTETFKGFQPGALVEVVPDADSKQVDLRIGFEGYRQDDPRAAAGLIAASVLGGGFGSKLWTRLREKEQVTYGVYASHGATPLYGLARIAGKVTPQNLRRAISATAEEVKMAGAEGMTVEDFELAKKREISGLMLESAQPGAAAASALGDALSGQQIKTVEQKVAEIEAVTIDQARQAVNELFDFNKVKIVARGPIADASEIQGGLDDAQIGVALTEVPYDSARYDIGAGQ